MLPECCLLASLARAAVQMLNVSRVGEEPDLIMAEEDTRLLFGPNKDGEGARSGKRCFVGA